MKMYTEYWPLLLLLILDCTYSLPGKICKVPNADAGICTVVSSCDPLYRLYSNSSRSPEEDAFLRQSAGSCSSKGLKIKVCCPPKSQWSNLVVSPVIYPDMSNVTAKNQDATPPPKSEIQLRDNSTPPPVTVLTVESMPEDNRTIQKWLTIWKKFGQTEYCGTQARSLRSRSVSERVPDIDEYPWMALLEYGHKEFKCGGTLISRSHVLTAAHCLYTSPSKVRLSEYNITTEPNDVGYENSGGIGSVTVKIVEVQTTVIHPEHVYGTSESDVGLIRMKNKIDFTAFVRPICLPTKDYRSTNFKTGTKLFVSGWGSDKKYVNSEVKKSLLLPYVLYESCSEKYVLPVRRDLHICAGGQEGVDSCRGDSGGPLMYEFDKANFAIVGIVSSGASKCGTKDHPGLYMYVYNYVEWIIQIMYDDENSLDS